MSAAPPPHEIGREREHRQRGNVWNETLASGQDIQGLRPHEEHAHVDEQSLALIRPPGQQLYLPTPPNTQVSRPNREVKGRRLWSVVGSNRTPDGFWEIHDSR